MQKRYFCGKELLTVKKSKRVAHTILVLDLDNCCCAQIFDDGEIKVLFQEHSAVPHKHKRGGQSADRFARIRDNEITLWFKRINDYLKEVSGDIKLGISFVYKKRFINLLSSYNYNKIIEMRRTEYADLSGVYQYKGVLENGL